MAGVCKRSFARLTLTDPEKRMKFLKDRHRAYLPHAFVYRSADEYTWLLQTLCSGDDGEWCRNWCLSNFGSGSLKTMIGVVQSLKRDRMQVRIARIVLDIHPLLYQSVQDMKKVPFMQANYAHGLQQAPTTAAGLLVRETTSKADWCLKPLLNYLLETCVVSYKTGPPSVVRSETDALYKHVLYTLKSEGKMHCFFLSFIVFVTQQMSPDEQALFRDKISILVDNRCQKEI